MLSLGGAHVVALNPLSATSVLASLGALGVFLALFAETGLLIGIFLPGDSLLFTAGLLCTTRTQNSLHLSLPTVLIAAVAGALGGAQIVYLLGCGARPGLIGSQRSVRVRSAVERGRVALARYGAPRAI